ncbi:MAG: beta-propeller fold lactonase family protein [Bacillota bacterium]
MELLVGSLSAEGKIAYYKDDKCVWEMDMNCPKYICTDGKYYYSYSQGNPLVLYSFEKIGDSFEVKSTLELDETTLSHLAYSKTSNMLFCSSMDSGFMHAVNVCDGVFTGVAFSEMPGGEAPSKCHQVVLNKAEDTAIVVNILRNKIFFNEFSDGKFTEKSSMFFEGDILPRHVMYSAGEEVLYLVTEHSNEIIVIDYKNQAVIQRQTINPTYVLDKAQGATLQMDADKKILYVCIRGYNTISEFKILDDFTLEFVKAYGMHGANSRHMILTGDKKYLVCANIDTSNFSVIDVETTDLVLNIPFVEAISCLEVK